MLNNKRKCVIHEIKHRYAHTNPVCVLVNNVMCNGSHLLVGIPVFYENIKTCDITFTSQEDQISIFPSSSLCETRSVEMVAKSDRSEKRQPKRGKLAVFC